MPFRIIVLLIAAIMAALGSVAFPFLGVLAQVLLNFARPQDDRPNVQVLHIPLMISAATLLGTALQFDKVKQGVLMALKRMRVVWLLYALFLISASFSWTVLSSNRIYEFSVLLLFCVLSLGWLTNVSRWRWYVLGLIGSGMFVALRVIRNPSHMHEEIGKEQFARMSIAKGGTVFGNSNYLALLMVITIFLMLPLLGYYRRWWMRVAGVGMLGVAGYVFAGANSRGASIALAVGMLFLWTMQRNKAKAAVLGIILVGAGAAAAPASYWARLSTIATYQQDASATNRLELWNIALHLVEEHPIFGVGPDNFTLFAFNSPHDAYLQIGSEIGIPALFVYISVLLVGLMSARRARLLTRDAPPGSDLHFFHLVSQGVFCCVLAVVVQGCTTGLAHREVVYVFVALAIGLKAMVEKKKTVKGTISFLTPEPSPQVAVPQEWSARQWGSQTT